MTTFADSLATLPKTLDWEIVADIPTNPFTQEKIAFADKWHHPYDLNTGAMGAKQLVHGVNLYRSDSHEPLSRVNSTYGIIPNERFTTFVEKVDDANDDFEFMGYKETCNGRRIYAFFKTESEYAVGGTKMETFIVIKTSHDETSAFELYCYQVELICTNGLMRQVKSVMRSVRHSGSAAFSVKSLNLDPQKWMDWEAQDAERRVLLEDIVVNRQIAWAYASYVQNMNPTEYFTQFDTYGVGTDFGVATKGFNTISDIVDDIMRSVNERNGNFSAAMLQSGLTRYTSHTNSFDSKGSALAFDKLLERATNGRDRKLHERSDQFFKMVENPALRNAYTLLPTP